MDIFRALKYRNFRLFFVGHGISITGTWVQAVASGWLAYRLTSSPLILGVVAFASQAPIFLLGPFGGVIADRGNRRRILIVTQSIAMAQALVLAVLTMTGKIEIWHLITLGTLLGCVYAFDIPVRQAFVVDTVDNKEILGNAIALNSMMFNAAQLIGPSVAGILIAMFGEGVCFLINALSFVAVLWSLLAMKIVDKKKNPDVRGVIEGIKEGFRYVTRSVPMSHILLLLGVVSIAGASYTVLMPVFARDVLGGGPKTLGFLISSTGIGAFGATAYLASRKTVLGLGRTIAICSSIFALSLVAFAFSRNIAASMVMLAFAGFGAMAYMASSNTILQTIADDDKRGRVMSFYTMAFIGTAPIGSLLAGVLASVIGASNTIIVGGSVSFLASIVFAMKLAAIRKAIHPIYRKMGIIPEVALGLDSVTEFSSQPED